MTRTKIPLLAAASLALSACSSSSPSIPTGPDVETSFDGLTRMQGTVMDVAWAREDIDLTGYTRVMFEGIGVEYRPVSGPYSGRVSGMSSRSGQARGSQSEFRLDAATKAAFEEEITVAFVEEMARSDVFEIVETAGPDVLLVRAGLLDVVSRVPPASFGSSHVFIQNFGEATLVLEIRDSMSNAIFARAIDRRAAQRQGSRQRVSTATTRAEVRRLGRGWASTLRTGLETLITEGLPQ